MPFSDSQRKAIYTKGSNALVFASAGAGKTTVLVARLTKRILEDGLSLKEIVAMTFTEAAAATMKKRLRISLSKAKKDADDPVIIDRLDNELANLEDSAITTIHAFCLKLIKENYHLLDISPNRLEHIIDEGSIKVVKDRLLQEIIDRRLSAEDATFKSFSDVISKELFAFDTIKKAIFDTYATAMDKPEPLMWLESLKEENHYTTFNDFPKEVMNYYLKEIRDYIKELASTYKDIANLIRLQGEDDYDSFALKAKAYEDLLNEDDYPYLLSKLETEITTIPRKSENDEYKLLRDKVKGIIDDLAETLVDPSFALKVENLAIPYHNLIIDMTIELIEAYDSYKDENGYVDFNDFEHLAYKLLTVDDKKLAKKLQGRYKEIMIDEFQDTSTIQYAIAELIAKDDLFLVGDIKQSIYRFRAAKPEIMQGLKERADFEVIHIQENYRSSDFLVNFNNVFFERLMNDSFSAEDKQIAPLESQKTDNKRVLFHYIKDPSDKRLTKARLLYQEIENLHQQGVAYKDICVLVKTHNEKLPLKQVFDAMDLPYHMKEQEGLFKSYTIEVLQAYISYLLDDKDDIALMAILSSLYDYSDDDLVKVAKDKTILEDTTFLEDVKKMRRLFEANDIYGFFNYFMGIGNFYITKLDSKERANLDLLISSIEGYAISSLTDLYTYITEAGEQKVTAFDLSDDADVVKVMTIHNSKGLEFDYVFLYSQSENRAQDRASALITDGDLGLGLRLAIDERRVIVETLRRKAIKYKEDAEDLAEYCRLLYVAMTRAKKGLYIIDTISEPKKEKAPRDLLKMRKGFTSFIQSLMADSELIDFIEHPDITGSLIPIKHKKDAITQELKYSKSKEKKIIRPSDHGLRLELSPNKGMDYGTRVHHILEKIDLKHIDKEHILAIDKEVEATMLRSIEKLAEDPLWQEIITGEVHRELPFYLREEDTTSEGIMDLVSILPDKVILVDYKSDHLDESSAFIKRYKRQLTIYRHVLNKAYDKKIESYIYSFHLGQFISVD